MSMYSEFYLKAERAFSFLPLKSKWGILAYIGYLIQRQLSPATIRHIISVLNRFCKSLSEEKQDDLARVNKNDIRRYTEGLSHQKLCASSINGHLSNLRGFYSFLIDEDYYLGNNPVLRRYHIEQEKRLPRPMKEEDLEKFLKTLEKARDRAMFLLKVRSGLRAGEVSRLKVDNIKWEKQNLIVYNGKGKVDRVVYFSPDAQAALRFWLATRNYNSDYCFRSPYKNAEKPISTRMIQYRMQSLLSESGLTGKGYGPHTLRHTFATTMLNAGMRLEALRDLMGHKTTSQTEMYAKLYEQTVYNSYTKAMEKIEKKSTSLKEPCDGLSTSI